MSRDIVLAIAFIGLVLFAGVEIALSLGKVITSHTNQVNIKVEEAFK
ncbi:MAG: hypothetical protein ACREBR_05445 [bacterium]